jgi:hypothetical protein
MVDVPAATGSSFVEAREVQGISTSGPDPWY